MAEYLQILIVEDDCVEEKNPSELSIRHSEGFNFL